MNPIDGFDPLSENLEQGAPEKVMIEEATKRVVLNILKSYTGYFDAFSEMIQNSLDALDDRKKFDPQFKPQIWIDIDLSQNRLRLVDNGVGMSLEEFKYCFRPNVSFKRRREHRGHKGVGATFLAYGFSLIRLQTKRHDSMVAGLLRQGREWAEDTGSYIKRPRFEGFAFSVQELISEKSGTCIEILIGDKQRPQLGWLQAQKAQQWLDALRIKTPLGGIYLTAKERQLDVNVTLTVTQADGTKDTSNSSKIDYYYPHEMPVLSKIQSLDTIEKVMESIKGDPEQKFTKLPNDFRRLDAVWQVWTKDQILQDHALVLNLEDDQKALIEKHQMSIYGCFVSTATSWTEFKSKFLKVRSNADLLKGGLQLASDFMAQGDLHVIPLTSTIGYQANTHVVVHLMDGNPDMGRKVFQPEIKVLAEELAKRVVAVFKKYLKLMREDTGAPLPFASNDLFKWKMLQQTYRDKHALEMTIGSGQIAMLSAPQSEQDVIALFHEMIGAGILRTYGFLATSESERYDSLFVTRYYGELDEYSLTNPMGVSPKAILPGESQPYVLEYKYNFDALISDFECEKKFEPDINLVVCWTLGKEYSERYVVRSYLHGDEGATRHFFGATHAAFLEGRKLFEIICLADLVSFVKDPEGTKAIHKTKFD